KKETPKKKHFIEKTANISDTKQFIYNELLNVLSYLIDIKDLKNKLLKKGIECITTFNKTGLSGVSFRYNEQAYKGSQIGIKAKDIVKAIQKNQISGTKRHINSLNVFCKNIQNALKSIVTDYENGNLYPNFNEHFKRNEIDLEPEHIFFKGYRISNKPIKHFRKTSETYVLGALKDFEYKTHHYNDLMNQIPKEVPLLFGRDKILAENKRLLKEQQNAIEPELKIKINRSNIPDYSTVFMKSIAEDKEKLAKLMGTETKNSESIAVENATKIAQKKRQGIRRRF
ncbi:MAG: hypothetical protein Q4G18_12705, partial [Myroides sp.]|nr:hypothetical protein [Myroides sp.]